MDASRSSLPARRLDRRAWLKASAALAVGALAAPPGLSLLLSPAAAAPNARPSAALAALAGSPLWLGSPPLGPEALQGRAVVVCFWTYSCINSLRVLPYLRAWASHYAQAGLTVVGVHTPEFAFEADAANVRRAVAELGVTFPVALDSDRRIWRAYDNDAWPAFYFIGTDGRVHDRIAGEGQYERSERLIRTLLAERPGTTLPEGLAVVQASGAEAPPDLRQLRSNETYVGWGQASGFASPGGLARDALRRYAAPRAPGLDEWGLAGAWNVGREYATAAEPGAGIALRFHARDLHLVLGPAADGRPVRYRIRIDGAPPGEDHGVDADAAGLGRIDAPRMFQLVRQRRPVADRRFEIEFLDPGARAYSFTFG